MNIVCFGQQNWSRTWTSKQQLMSRLARLGHQVLYVDPVTARGTARDTLRSVILGDQRVHLRRVGANGLTVLSYRVLPGIRWRPNLWWQKRVLSRVLDRMDLVEPLAIAFIPTARRSMEEIDPVATVYYAVDEWTTLVQPEEADRFRSEEERLLESCDLALGVSPALVERFRRIQPNSRLLNNAADAQIFSPGSLARAPSHPGLAQLQGPRLGFVGQIDDRMDLPLLEEVAGRNPDWNLIFVGRVEGVDPSGLFDLPNVHYLGFLPYEEIPTVLRELDVGLIPYRDTLRSRSCSPLKVFEYLASGLPVVASPLPAYREVRHVLELVREPGEMETAVGRAMEMAESRREERLKVAGSHTWEARARQLEDRLQETRARVAERRGRPLLPMTSGKRPLHNAAITSYFGRHPRPRDLAVSGQFRALVAVSGILGRAVRSLRRAGKLLGYGSGRLRILVVRRGFLGDLIVFLPALRELRQRFPDAFIALCVQEAGMRFAEPARELGYVDEIREADFKEAVTRSQQFRIWVELVREGFDLALMPGRLFSLNEAFLTGVAERVGVYDGAPMARLNRRVVPYDPRVHEAELNLALVDCLGSNGGPRETHRYPTLPPSEPQVDRELEALLEEVGVPSDSPLVVLHPGSKRLTRRWPPERFAALADSLLEGWPALRVAWSGVEREREWIEDLRGKLAPAHRRRSPSLAGRTDLSLLSALMDRATALVCNDTGVMHLARAKGTPLVALLGPGEERRWSPHPLGRGPSVALREVRVRQGSAGLMDELGRLDLHVLQGLALLRGEVGGLDHPAPGALVGHHL